MCFNMINRIIILKCKGWYKASEEEGLMVLEMREGVMERVRLRLLFDGQHILSDTQKKEGLKKTWILLKPKQFNTISDLTDYILRIFHLNHSCPHGLVLSMDGFVLPPFESSRILKDNDVVCVRRKRGVSTEIIELDNGANALERVQTLKQSGHTVLKVLANQEFEKETRGYESEPDDADEREKQEDIPDVNKVSKKRKRSKKLQGSKRKKSKLSTAEESPIVLEDVQNNTHEVKRGSSHYCSLLKKDKSSDVQGEPEKSSAPEHMPDAKRYSQIQQNGKGNVDLSSKKLPSRSARRKKVKRQWLREQANLEKMKLHQKQLFTEDNLQLPDKDDQNLSAEHQQQDSNSHGKDSKGLSEGYRRSNLNCDADDDIVPVVIRPGHIRFEPLDKDAVQAVQQNHIPVETFQWNGITSKKKGQKWGKEKAVFSKRSSHGNFNQFSETQPIEEEIPIRKDMDFDKLPHYTGLPKEGDVIAYRLIELSLSWTPEPTTFRAGKISSYDSETNRIMLAPVPDYPVVFEKKTDEDASAIQSDTLYGEDGSLQIDFSLLLDVRIVMHGGEVNAVHGREQDTLTNFRNSNKHEQAHAPTQENGKVSVENRDAVTNVGDNSNNEKTHAISQENENLNAWEEINQVLCTKKAELSDPNRKESSRHSGRLSHKALRSSALGPTMAFLRSQNEL